MNTFLSTTMIAFFIKCHSITHHKKSLVCIWCVFSSNTLRFTIVFQWNWWSFLSRTLSTAKLENWNLTQWGRTHFVASFGNDFFWICMKTNSWLYQVTGEKILKHDSGIFDCCLGSKREDSWDWNSYCQKRKCNIQCSHLDEKY